jgi:hypothetical protein
MLRYAGGKFMMKRMDFKVSTSVLKDFDTDPSNPKYKLMICSQLFEHTLFNYEKYKIIDNRLYFKDTLVGYVFFNYDSVRGCIGLKVVMPESSLVFLQGNNIHL